MHSCNQLAQKSGRGSEAYYVPNRDFISRSSTSTRGPAPASKCSTPTARGEVWSRLVLLGAPAWLFSRWLAYWAVRYGLRCISPRDECAGGVIS
jgi:hypothetical protein